MKQKMLVTAFVVVVILAGALLSGCEKKTTPPPVVPGQTLQEKAVNITNLLKQKDYQGVYGYFNSSISSRLSLSDFQATWQQQVTAVDGNITNIVTWRETNESGYHVVYVTCNYSKKPVLDVKITFDSQGLIIQLTVVVPSWLYVPPAYANQSSFTEMNVTVGSGEWQLPGILTVPKGNGTFPAVVLVSGSGPNDQDETVGPNKPFKDIAWGLASRGIVVLRYPKRTLVYPQQFLQIKNFTVEDEVIDDVIAAVDVLNSTSFVDKASMFVLGHSLGGMLAPRIASQDARLSGIIILAGPTRPLEDLILEQTWYLANLSGTNQSAAIAAVKENVTRIKELNFTGNEFIFGAPKSYWADLANYDPVETAEKLVIPMLILQGLRDYQVTMEDFARWNSTFHSNIRVKLITYLALNHLFLYGTGVPSNAEYLIAGNVAEQVIIDTASWMENH